MSKILERIKKRSDDWAIKRKFIYKKNSKKISPEALRSEINIARFLGEMSGAEEILVAIVNNPEWDRADIEAQVHMFVRDLNSIASEYLGTQKVIDIEEILEIHGYYNSKGN